MQLAAFLGSCEIGTQQTGVSVIKAAGRLGKLQFQDQEFNLKPKAWFVAVS